MRKSARRSAGRPRRAGRTRGPGARSSEATGTYVLDRMTGRLVKVSGRVPSLHKASGEEPL
ncbi:MAG: hypothetical protein HY554_04255 [Elusimicrobia bacterium]|nr:hypothetical protein [Elusimicrobiota bacterium]